MSRAFMRSARIMQKCLGGRTMAKPNQREGMGQKHAMLLLYAFLVRYAYVVCVCKAGSVCSGERFESRSRYA